VVTYQRLPIFGARGSAGWPGERNDKPARSKPARPLQVRGLRGLSYEARGSASGPGGKLASRSKPLSICGFASAGA